MDKPPVDVRTVDSRMPERMMLGADEVTILATSAQTAGALFVVEVRMPQAAVRR